MHDAEILILKIGVSFLFVGEELKMNEIIEKENIIIEDMIYEIRGVQVMLDSDIAKLYKVETKRINEAVKIIRINFLKGLALEYPKKIIVL